MKADTHLLANCAKCDLFAGVSETAYSDVLKYLHAKIKVFKRGEIIMHIGDR
jgi:hypothetical protein